MHILQIANYAPPYGGGIQTVIAELATRTVARGHRVTILAARTGLSFARSPWYGIERIGVPASNALEGHGVPYPLFHPSLLRRTLREVLPMVDVIHGHGFLYLDVLAAALMRREQRFVLTEHVGHVPYRQPLFDGLQRLAIATIGRAVVRRADAVVVLNARVEREMAALARRGVLIARIPNGIDIVLFRPLDDRMKWRSALALPGPVILFAGRNTTKKGLPLVIDAARRLLDVTFIIAGQDTDLLTDTPPNVRLVGQIDRAELRGWYGVADALILPSEGEGFPLVVQEALACGCPVIVSDDPAYRDNLDSSIATFAERTTDGVTTAIRQFLDRMDDGQRDAARAWALRQFNWETTLDHYMALYQGTVSSSGQVS